MVVIKIFYQLIISCGLGFDHLAEGCSEIRLLADLLVVTATRLPR
jgi:hypothetical protein